MSAKSKTYVIDPVKSFMQKGGVMKRGLERKEYAPDGADSSKPRGAQERARRAESEPVNENGSPLRAFFAYLAGPYAILATHRGRESRSWIVFAILSCTALAIIAARASRIFVAPHNAGTGYLIWLGAACLAAAIGFATWARGAFLLGRHKGWLLKQLPGWLGNPGAAGFLGLIVPGFGLFVADHPRRAACALLAAGSTAVAALVLWQSPALWRLSQTAGFLAGHGDALERLFLVMAAIGAFGALAWVVQALDGARLAERRMRPAAQPHGDFAAIALAAAIVTLLAVFEPSNVAETLDRFAVSMREDGLRIVPLQAANAAMRLDPSDPQHAVLAIELNEALGRRHEALELRRGLAERWKPYERMLRLEAAAAEPVGPPTSDVGN